MNTIPFSVAALAQGFMVAIGLIAALGPQNLFVLRQGIVGTHVLVIVLVCALCDIALIIAGAMGMGSFIASLPWLNQIAIWGGVAFLLYFGVKSFRDAFKGSTFMQQLDSNVNQALSRRAAISMALAFSLLNPGVFLDTVVLLGAIGAQHEQTIDRLAFASGACLSSALWFFSIGFGAKWLSPLFKSPNTARVFDGVVGLIMFAVAYSLARPELMALIGETNA